ncbi:complex I subunit 4 family protein [Buchnera aphidicola]|uniref:complex I subunit 4 family protein n=1 Tax=Buchnera aphidicola TaxID=9 RepID=UPI002237E903|nr:NADH-quinone oxidoreductase subunit M [Buchnera aphidicola]MCW5197659.1 NADH-quinone oxidoreductase subunit M [Buchnera aphidicola (Chaitophorus viminalis)]
MFLCELIFIPLLGGIFSWNLEFLGKKVPRWILLFCMSLNLFLLINFFYNQQNFLFNTNIHHFWYTEFNVPWISNLGINFHLALDGLSFLMILLTIFLTFISILLTWNEKIKNIGFFYFCMMFIVSNLIGIFLSVDLFLFFVFWEILSIPIYFLMVLWGKKVTSIGRSKIANKYLINSQISGLILLISIISLVKVYYDQSNILTFNLDILKNVTLNNKYGLFIMIGFFTSLMIKIPLVPFHSWFPNFHKNTPVSGAFDLIGIIIKTGIYGLLRFNIFLFSNVSQKYSIFFYILGLFCIFYSVFLACTQNSIKKVIAYMSISHMGFVLIGIISGNNLAYKGIILYIISYSLSTSALIILTRILYKNFQTDNFKKMGGLWKNMFFVPGFFLFFIMSSLGIPGTGNFIGEFLILLGSFPVNPIFTLISMIGLVFFAICFLNMFHKIFYGSNKNFLVVYNISILEFLILFILSFLIIFFGLYPNIIFNISNFLII